MAILDDLWNGAKALRVYNPYRIQGFINPAFTPADGLVLDLKDNIPRGITAAAKDFGAFLDTLTLPEHTVLVVVPGHEARPTNRGRGLARVVALLVRERPRLIDGSDVLLRTQTIDKLATGGRRETDVHLGSIVVDDPVRIERRVVLILDDVTTTGGSLAACRSLLRTSGAMRVGAIALARTA